MRFLKALQKSDVERPERSGNEPRSAPDNGGISNKVPRLFENPNLKIGNGRPDSAEPLQPGNSVQISETKPGDVIPKASEYRLSSVKQFQSASVDPSLVNHHLIAITQPNSPFTEEYRILRTHLLQESEKRKLQTVAIVSVAPAEGKSVTALNLSWLLAQMEGVNVLLVDGDLRRPSLANYLGLNVDAGLSDVLGGDVELQDSIVRLEPAGLHLLPGGDIRSDAAEQISGPRFVALLDAVSEQFDYVIVDAPPFNVFTDAKVLMNYADGALLVVRANHTSYKDIDRVLEGLPRERMLGTVLNQSEETLVSGNYYKYPYYNKS